MTNREFLPPDSDQAYEFQRLVTSLEATIEKSSVAGFAFPALIEVAVRTAMKNSDTAALRLESGIDTFKAMSNWLRSH